MWTRLMTLFRRPLVDPQVMEERDMLRLQRDFERDRMHQSAGAWLDTLTAAMLDDLKSSKHKSG